MADVEPLDAVAKGPDEVRVLVRRIGEEMQKDESAMAALRRVGALPEKVVTVAAGAEGVLIGSGGETAEIDPELASHLFVHRL
jgi:DtxR family transcriptional regulator, Mn-dependent transcriptional regulator